MEGNGMHHNKMLDLITSSYSWEQVIYNIIALEGLDPWDLDLRALSTAFCGYLTKIQTLDFKVPAKYVIISSMLLRMKSDHLHFLDFFEEGNGDIDMDEQAEEQNELETSTLEINPITLPPRRMARRKVMVNELIDALRKALKTQDRRVGRKERARKQIKVKEDEISKRIAGLYSKINTILTRIKGEEIKFSSLVTDRTNKKEMTDTFLPLVYLDHDKRVACRQEEMFEEIYIKNGEKKGPFITERSDKTLKRFLEKPEKKKKSRTNKKSKNK
jgi:chromatin segregation and condensation protein Rec8/ScpA/Scc1 (kleisin family)